MRAQAHGECEGGHCRTHTLEDARPSVGSLHGRHPPDGGSENDRRPYESQVQAPAAHVWRGFRFLLSVSIQTPRVRAGASSTFSRAGARSLALLLPTPAQSADRQMADPSLGETAADDVAGRDDAHVEPSPAVTERV